MISSQPPFLSISLVVAAIGFLATRASGHAAAARTRALVTATLTLLLGLASAVSFTSQDAPVLRDALFPGLGVDTATGALIPLVSLVALAVLVLSPRATMSRSGAVDVMWGLGFSLLAFSSSSLTLLTAAWALAALPVPRWLDGHGERRPALALLALGSLPLVGAVAWLTLHHGPVSVWSPHVDDVPPPTQTALLALVIVSAMARTPLFPFHPWLVALVRRDLSPLGLTLASPLSGLYLLLRFNAILPEAFPRDLPWIAAIGIASAVIFAAISLGQRDQLGTMLYLVMSQFGLVFMGLGEVDSLTVSGSLVLWLAQGVAGTGLVLMALGVRWRRGPVLLDGFHGLVRGAPHMTGAYFLFGMSVVGLPGTITFVAEELLGQGILLHHPGLAAAFVGVTALNAVTFMRAFGRVFLGEATRDEARCPDLRPNERAVVLALAAALILPGIFPHPVIRARSRWANEIITVGGDGAHAPAPGHATDAPLPHDD